MIDLHTSTKQLKTLILEKIDHSFLNKFIKQPEINEQKLHILSLIMDNSSLSPYEKNRYILTTMLVQIALDTHDQVPNNDHNSTSSLTSKQLTVLAGDYYSGLYYLLLAEIEDYEMIHVLASAIKEINEYKMQLYFRDARTLEEYINIIKKIDSLLIVRVAEHINSSVDSHVIGDLLITSKLLDEKRCLYRKGYTSFIKGWIDDSNDTYSAAFQIIEAIIQQNTDSLADFVTDTKHASFKDSVHYMLNEIMFSNTTVAEEG